MPESENGIINRAFMQLARRSERIDRNRLVETFVDVGPLFTLLSSHDHQIIFGRRGTGKTHALNYLSDTRAREGDVVVYVDLSNIGSSGGIYADQGLPITERATRLLVDTLLAVHETLYEYFVMRAEDFDLSDWTTSGRFHRRGVRSPSGWRHASRGVLRRGAWAR